MGEVRGGGSRVNGMSDSVIKHGDGIHRCFWCGSEPLYVGYHDDEWGVPEYDSQALFEKLLLDGFQAGLSWITILRKRDAFRKAFDDFDPETMARFNAKKVGSLMNDAGIVRNRAKIEASVSNAQAYLAIEEKQPFSEYLWNFVDGKPIQNKFRSLGQIPAATPLAEKVSKDLKAKGFRFCGPTIVYAFMQACGFVNDHMTRCHRHDAVAKLAR
jgi:DNA-3-methyladenine glycosylase I